ncbi:hypothetical protein [Herminiimonas contaminans]|uniref:Uncharacterized protein n=1 Tax=Herminiimonas contaminans TaxID=1111140 RepID=A0ABS0EY03_9BURK|nr:hypothetical protein [Herminiimonas contaminans]MBF8179740.1 hypothetical protein [Herminiimonas contaminans]
MIAAASLVISILGIFLAIHHNQRTGGCLTVSLNPSRAVNPNGIGTYSAALITVANKGRESILFGGFHALSRENEYWYPPSTLKPSTKLEPGQYIQGTISMNVISNARVLWAVDGTGKKYRVNRFLLKKVVKFLRHESTRLSSLGLE